MKTLNYFFLSLFSISLIAACDVSQTDFKTQDETNSLKAIASDIDEFDDRISKPFKAKFFTSQVRSESGFIPEKCPGPDFTFFNVQEGSGQATHLGKFTTRITFCVDVTKFPVPYNNGKGTFIAANGDKLNITISGLVKPHNNPNDKYELEFQDPFSFVGGTGRFADAEGSGMTNSLVDLLEGGGDRTDHEWTGTIKVAKKK